MKRRFWLFALLLGCGRDCKCTEGERHYEHIDGKWKVELVSETKWTGGKVPGPMTYFYVRVHTDPPFDQWVSCSHVDLDESEDGMFVGYRCKDTSTWSLLRLVHGTKWLDECTTTLVGKEPDYAHARPLDDAAQDILACASKYGIDYKPDTVFRTLVKEIHASGGSLVRFLAESLVSGPLDPWVETAMMLSPSDRGDLEKRVCDVLEHPGKSGYTKAFAICPLGRKEIGDEALAYLKTSFAGSGLPVDGYDWVLAIALASHPTELGDAACAHIETITGDHRTEALAAIAASKVRCPALDKLVEERCDRIGQCDAGTCTQSDLAPAIEIWMELAKRPPPRHIVDLPTQPDSLLYAGFTQGLSPDFTLRYARAKYTIDMGSGASCFDPLDAGTPCKCEAPVQPSHFCKAPLDAGVLTYNHCRFKIDDKKKTIGDVRFICAHVADPCPEYNECCDGLTCKTVDAGLTCQP